MAKSASCEADSVCVLPETWRKLIFVVNQNVRFPSPFISS